MLIKKTTLTFILILISASLFAFEGIEKKANTKDGYNFKLYQVDKTEKPKCYEYYVQLTSDDSEEYFIWCFDKLNEAMEHFKWQKYDIRD